MKLYYVSSIQCPLGYEEKPFAKEDWSLLLVLPLLRPYKALPQLYSAVESKMLQEELQSSSLVHLLYLTFLVLSHFIQSMDDQCPVCKSDRYLNPKLRLLVSSCYHKMYVLITLVLQSPIINNLLGASHA